MTRLALIRHAQTQWNVQGRIQGREDSPLTPEGLTKADRWAETLAPCGFSALYASPQGRAAATAGRIGLKLNLCVQTHAGLCEQDFGQWTGRLVAELRGEGVLAPQEALGWAFRPPGGESRQELLLRATNALTRLAQAHQGQTILVVTHQGVLKSVLYALAGKDYLPGEPGELRARGLHWITFADGCLVPEAVNLAL